MRTVRRFLIINALGEARVVTRWPTVRYDEIAYRLNISIPDEWGRIKPADEAIDITLPDVPVAEVGVPI